ncbi:MAG: hypothetical protein NVS3B20_19110 [Polyangiales bacterium]
MSKRNRRDRGLALHPRLSALLGRLSLDPTTPPSAEQWIGLLRALNAELSAPEGPLSDLPRNRTSEYALVAKDHALEPPNFFSADRFVGLMSHELRTPLSAVIGMTQLLLDTELSTDQRESLEAVLRSGNTLLSLVNDVLDYSKIESGKFDLTAEDFDLVEAVDEVCNTLRVSATAKHLELKRLFDEKIPRAVCGDAGRFRQVLTNLVGNAIKFTAKGTVTVRIGVLEGAAKEEGYLIRVEVTDTGMGIPETEHHRLFRAFSQLDSSSSRAHGGTGLGLAISKQLAELMGGEIGLRSEAGCGSTFWFTVQLARGSTPSLRATQRAAFSWLRLPATAHPKSLLPSRTAQVLVVEDDDVNRLLAQRMLEKLGYQVTTVANGVRALEELERCAFDVVLMDCQMPEMDGFQTTRALRLREGSTRRTPVIAMTANAASGDRERCLEAGMDDYIAKPAGFRTLSAVIGRFLPPHVVPNLHSAQLNEASFDLKPLRSLQNDEKGGGRALASELIELFYVDVPRKVSAIRKALSGSDFTEARRQAHALRGSSSSLGATRLSNVAGAIEDLPAHASLEEFDELLRNLEKEFATVRLLIDADRAEM